MSFYKLDEDGKVIRKRVVLDCSGDTPLTEQSHKAEVNINNIVKRHGVDMIAKTAMLRQGTYVMDNDPTNDFHEAMMIVTRAQETFDSLSSQIRKEFDNSPAKFMDFVQNPKNIDRMVELGLASPPPPASEPIEVRVINPETPPATT